MLNKAEHKPRKEFGQNFLKAEHKPRKEFGQHFLIDEGIIAEILNTIAPKPHEEIIEIGPGTGAITGDLVTNCHRLILIEIDNDLSAKLAMRFNNQIAQHKLFILNQDILKVDLLKLPLKTLEYIDLHNPAQKLDPKNLVRIVGNLPYNISSPLLFKLFTYSKYLRDLNFLLQKEFAHRLIAKPNTKQYGRLSVMAQYHAKIDLMFNVPATAFKPIPKVESSMVRILPYHELPYVANNYQHFSELVKTAFTQRRKVLSNCLRKYCTSLHLKNLDLDPTLRPEQLSVSDLVKISNSL